MGTCVLREEPFPRWRPQGQLTEQRAYEDDDLHSGGELAVQLRLAELPERAAVGAGRLGPRPVARLAGVSGNPAAVMPHGEAGATALFVARPSVRPPPIPAPVSPAWGAEGHAGAWWSSGEPGAVAVPVTSPHHQPRSLGGGDGGGRGCAPCPLPPGSPSAAT